MLRDGVFSSELAITPLHSQRTVNDRNHSMTVFCLFFYNTINYLYKANACHRFPKHLFLYFH